jgi:manganese transport protein
MSVNKNSSSESLSEVHGSVDINQRKGLFKKFLAFLGPAYLISVGYMDPGNWATDLAGGSKYGYGLIWVLLMSNMIALLLQSLSARLGIVRGRDLAQASRETYPKYVNYFLYFLAEIAIAACDLAEVLGMAIGLQLLFGLPLMMGVIISVLDTFILLFLINFGIRKMEAFIITLVAMVGLSFFAEMIFAQPQLGEVVKGFVPSLPDSDALYIAIGIIGATVMPHNLYLHSALVQTRKIGNIKADIKRALKFNFIDSAIALNLAFFVNAAILILAATAFYKNGLYEVAEIQDAHRLLEPMLGTRWAPVLFAVALIAAGQSSTITGTLAGQIIMEGYLNLRIQPWVRRIITRLIAVVPSLLAIYYIGEEATGKLLILSQVILSMQLGFAIIPLIHFVSDQKKMGTFVIGIKTKIFAWISAAIIVSLNIKLVIEEIIHLQQKFPNQQLLIMGLVIPFLILSLVVLLYITFSPFVSKGRQDQAATPHGHQDLDVVISKKQYQRIAVAVDFSDSDNAALSQVTLQAQKNTTLILIHVLESAGALILGEEIKDHESTSDIKQLEKYKQRLTALGYQVETALGYGNPKKQIPQLVAQKQAELLIMATHGHKGFKDFLFGTTLDKVRHNVKIPVLIVGV